MMTSYVAKEMARLGLEPGGENGTWFQTVPMVRRSADTTSTLIVNGQPLALFTEFALIRPTSTVRVSATLPPGTYGTIYGGRAGDSSVRLERRRCSEPDHRARRSAQRERPADGSLHDCSGCDRRQISGRSGNHDLGHRHHDDGDVELTSLARSRRSGKRANAHSIRNGHVRISGGEDHGSSARLIETGCARRRRSGERAVHRWTRRSGGAQRHRDRARKRSRRCATNTSQSARTAITSRPAMRAVDHDSLKAYNLVMRPNGADGRVASTAPATPRAARARYDRSWTACTALIHRVAIPFSTEPTMMDRDRSQFSRLQNRSPECRVRAARFFSCGTPAKSPACSARHGSPITPPFRTTRSLRSSTWTWSDAERNATIQPAGRATSRSWDHAGCPPTSATSSIPSMPRRRRRTSSTTRSMRRGRFRIATAEAITTCTREPEFPIAYISRGYHSDYHMVTDEPQYISYQGLANVATFVRDIALAVANRNDRVRVDKPKPNPLAPCQQ